MSLREFGIHQVVLRIIRELGTTAVLVTHDLAEAISLCDQVFIITKRPGGVVSKQRVTFGKDRNVIGLREKPEFLAYMQNCGTSSVNSSPDASIDRTIGRPSVPRIQVLKKGVRSRRLRLLATQLTIIVAVLLAWQYLPEVSALKNRTHLLDRFFISSPSQIGSELYNLALGRGGEP